MPPGHADRNASVSPTHSGRAAFEWLVAARTTATDRYSSDRPPQQRREMHDVVVGPAQRIASENFATELDSSARS